MASLAASPGIAVAQDRDGEASPRELWRDYPLTQEDDGGRAPPRAESSGGAPAERTREGSGDGGVGPAVIVPVAALIALLVLLAGFGVRRVRRRGRRPPGVAPRPTASQSPRPAPTWEAARQSAWTAQISWRRDHGAARFCVMAAPPGGEEATVMESASIPWPPESDAGVQSLIDEVGKLERAVVAAGWEATEPGSSWFARRFVWTRTDRAPELAIGPARIAGRA